MMSLPSIWVIGDWREPVFEEAVAGLRSRADCQCFDSPDAALVSNKSLSNGAFPQAIVLVQSRPGQFSGEQIEKLHAREPLAHLIALTGPWCEGEQRSGRPIPGVTRIAWRSWRERLPIELAISSEATPWPRTTAETERIEAMAKYASHLPRRRGFALICTAQLADYNYLADAARHLGLLPRLYDATDASATSAEVVIFDGWEQASLFQRNQPSQNGQTRPIGILVLHFPRPEDEALAQSGGIDVILPHPLSVADLSGALSRLLHCAA
jgi:hypothetical protein